MSLLLILPPPRARLSVRAADVDATRLPAELDFVFSADGRSASQSGRAAAALLPRADSTALVLADADVDSTMDGAFLFDTWTQSITGWDDVRVVATAGGPPPVQAPTAIPLRMRVQKVKIVLRVWDPKLKLTRQSTIIQDL